MAMMQSRWYVDACWDKAFKGSDHAIVTDFWSEVEEFVWDKVQEGFNCLIIDHKTGERKYAFAEDFNETTLSPKEIIRNTKK